jgi:transcription initiation factor TFIID subunit 2
MTLRVYDDEGTPYEQTIDIRETVHRAEIQYNNTRRAKRKRKDTSALTNGDLPLVGEDVVLSLGDVLTSPSDVQDWKLADWTPDEEDRMASDAFEWIRIDADLEWICDISLGMSEWMYAAQLRQDRDVIAQYEVSSFKFSADNSLSNSLPRSKNL